MDFAPSDSPGISRCLRVLGRASTKHTNVVSIFLFYCLPDINIHDSQMHFGNVHIWNPEKNCLVRDVAVLFTLWKHQKICQGSISVTLYLDVLRSEILFCHGNEEIAFMVLVPILIWFSSRKVFFLFLEGRKVNVVNELY